MSEKNCNSHTVSFSHWLCEEADLWSISYHYSDRESVLGRRPRTERSRQPSQIHAGLRGMGNSSGNENGSDPVKYYWEIITDNLKKVGSSLGYVSTLDASGRTMWMKELPKSFL